MRLSRKLAAAAAVMGAVALLVPSSAYAAEAGGGAVIVTGSGTIHPGLTPVPLGETQAVTFNGTATGLGLGVDDLLAPTADAAVDVGTLNCSFAGHSTIPETSLAGAGTVSGSCNGTGVSGPITIGCSFTYVRETGLVQIAGTCTVNASGIANLTGPVSVDIVAAGVFAFVPTTVAPTTSYLLAGAASGAGASA